LVSIGPVGSEEKIFEKVYTNVSGDFTSSVLFFMLKEPSIGGQCHAYCPGMYSLYEG
jgi:hypothetical protein